MRKILLIAIVVLVPGCAQLIETSDRAAEKIGEGVTYYCDKVPADVRAQFRAKVNQYAAPNSVQVSCADGATL